MSAIVTRVLAAGRTAVEMVKVLVGGFRCRLADARRHRALIEQEIYHGRYKISSKNDDDLPAVR
ncbi:MAG TPA: hypothetical protein VMH84_08160 [Xanthobacteraceae bacterium]|nr:hypothetical protein [Xanthobacteraceae bacterium]